MDMNLTSTISIQALNRLDDVHPPCEDGSFLLNLPIQLAVFPEISLQTYPEITFY